MKKNVEPEKEKEGAEMRPAPLPLFCVPHTGGAAKDAALKGTEHGG